MRYVPKRFSMTSDVWVILDCEKDECVRHTETNKYGVVESRTWKFNHAESAKYHADLLNLALGADHD